MTTPGGVASSRAVVPLSYSEIRAWAELTDRRLRPVDVELLRELDLVWLAKPEWETP